MDVSGLLRASLGFRKSIFRIFKIIFYDENFQFYDKKTDFRPGMEISSETTIPGISSQTTILGISSETTETRALGPDRQRGLQDSRTARLLSWIAGLPGCQMAGLPGFWPR